MVLGVVALRTLRVALAGAVATWMAVRGVRKRSLSAGGGMAAFGVGFLGFLASYRMGALLIAFYLSASHFTKWDLKDKRKQRAEWAHKEGGQREASQVLACSALGTVIAVVFKMRLVLLWHGLGDFDTQMNAPFAGGVWAWSNVAMKSDAFVWERRLLAAYVAHYACCAADTWASELGVLATGAPRLVTTWRTVPRGTNGGVTGLGLLVSIAGGVFIGLCLLLLDMVALAMIVGVGAVHTQVDPKAAFGLLLFSGAAGLVGSLLDSLLGALVQATYYDTDRKCIVQANERQAFLLENDEDGTRSRQTVKRICGVDLLTNEQVNIVSVVLTTVLGGLAADLWPSVLFGL